ncbi:hypothetical protein L6452_18301 [Arctium lappa]|uniref:Uncharacterized protein n=1 Tax=Arctium lappa TaxID=4217 RepID=A0ACB9C5Y5_ARCLA|nr:hypothetical protein L6452_18301 [Arctium lappa]
MKKSKIWEKVKTWKSTTMEIENDGSRPPEFGRSCKMEKSYLSSCKMEKSYMSSCKMEVMKSGQLCDGEDEVLTQCAKMEAIDFGFVNKQIGRQ